MPIYRISEVIFAAINLHVFRVGSRNGFNNLRKERNFIANYFKAFKMNFPHLDTVDIAMRNIPNDVLEKLKVHLVKSLITKKLFYKYRILGKYFNITIDATGTQTISDTNVKNFPNALYKIYNKGTDSEKKVYFIYVLEAKLVCRNGFCISLGTEWIENAEAEFEKQDCELKAFYRLAEKLKISFPKLPICIVGDGLYPNKKVFEICKANNWEWIFTFKEGNLQAVWGDVFQKQISGSTSKNELTDKVEIQKKDEQKKVVTSYNYYVYTWIKKTKYLDYEFSWGSLAIYDEHGEDMHNFVYVSSIEMSKENIKEIIDNGRMRSKIENEGFNSQKNSGYALKHKFSETSELAMKNYYTCLQVGHLINQIFELQISIKNKIRGRKTLRSLWSFIKSFFSLLEISVRELNHFVQTPKQIKFE